MAGNIEHPDWYNQYLLDIEERRKRRLLYLHDRTTPLTADEEYLRTTLSQMYELSGNRNLLEICLMHFIQISSLSFPMDNSIVKESLPDAFCRLGMIMSRNNIPINILDPNACETFIVNAYIYIVALACAVIFQNEDGANQECNQCATFRMFGRIIANALQIHDITAQNTIEPLAKVILLQLPPQNQTMRHLLIEIHRRVIEPFQNNNLCSGLADRVHQSGLLVMFNL